MYLEVGKMVTSPTDRDLSVESGIVIGAPGKFYPATTEEPNHTEARYEAFMRLIIDDLSQSGWIVESRERYYPGLPDTGGGIEDVRDLVTVAMEIGGPIIGLLGLGASLFPKDAERLGNRIKSGLSACKFHAAWRRSLNAMKLQPDPLDFPVFLQHNIEGLCLLDALSGRYESEQDFQIISVFSVPNDYASAAHPSGPEVYKVTVSSNMATYTYHVNGRGRGVKETRPRLRRWHSTLEVDLVD